MCRRWRGCSTLGSPTQEKELEKVANAFSSRTNSINHASETFLMRLGLVRIPPVYQVGQA